MILFAQDLFPFSDICNFLFGKPSVVLSLLLKSITMTIEENSTIAGAQNVSIFSIASTDMFDTCMSDDFFFVVEFTMSIFFSYKKSDTNKIAFSQMHNDRS